MLAEETRLRRQARAAALPRVTGEARGYHPRVAPVRTVGAVNAPTPEPPIRWVPTQGHGWLDSRGRRQPALPITTEE